MHLLSIFHWIQDTSLSDSLRKSDHLVGAAFGVFHVIGLILLLSALLLISLRLLGLGLRQQPVRQLTRSLSPLFWTGLAILVFSGTITFMPSAVFYYNNPALWIKAVLLLLAILVQVSLFRKITQLDEPGPILAKTTALLTLSLWFGVGLAGRAIGYL